MPRTPQLLLEDFPGLPVVVDDENARHKLCALSPISPNPRAHSNSIGRAGRSTGTLRVCAERRATSSRASAEAGCRPSSRAWKAGASRTGCPPRPSRMGTAASRSGSTSACSSASQTAAEGAGTSTGRTKAGRASGGRRARPVWSDENGPRSGSGFTATSTLAASPGIASSYREASWPEHQHDATRRERRQLGEQPGAPLEREEPLGDPHARRPSGREHDDVSGWSARHAAGTPGAGCPPRAAGRPRSSGRRRWARWPARAPRSPARAAPPARMARSRLDGAHRHRRHAAQRDLHVAHATRAVPARRTPRSTPWRWPAPAAARPCGSSARGRPRASTRGTRILATSSSGARGGLLVRRVERRRRARGAARAATRAPPRAVREQGRRRVGRGRRVARCCPRACRGSGWRCRPSRARPAPASAARATRTGWRRTPVYVVSAPRAKRVVGAHRCRAAPRSPRGRPTARAASLPAESRTITSVPPASGR